MFFYTTRNYFSYDWQIALTGLFLNTKQYVFFRHNVNIYEYIIWPSGYCKTITLQPALGKLFAKIKLQILYSASCGNSTCSTTRQSRIVAHVTLLGYSSGIFYGLCVSRGLCLGAWIEHNRRSSAEYLFTGT